MIRLSAMPTLNRRSLLLAAALPALWRPAAAAELPPARSLGDELTTALAQGQPLVVMVSLDGCPYCKIARDHYLAPLRQQEGLPVVQVDMRSRAPVLDFRGATVTQDDLVQRWKIRVAPTVLFFGRGGAEVAERLVGGYIPDFYGAYLDQRLAQARNTLR